MRPKKVTVFVCLALFSLSASILLGDDWSRWMGPDRNNTWNETNIIESFPEGGPPVVWRAKISGGYSGPAVADGRVFITDYVTKDNVKIPNFERTKSTGLERVLCLDQATGEEIWKHEYPVTYGISYPSGPPLHTDSRWRQSVHVGR